MSKPAEHSELPEDKRIKELICEKFTEPHSWDSTGIHVEVGYGVVTLTGVVSNKEDLHRAEAIAASVAGVVRIENKLEIKGTGIAEVISEIGSDIARFVSGDDPGKKKDTEGSKDK